MDALLVYNYVTGGSYDMLQSGGASGSSAASGTMSVVSSGISLVMFFVPMFIFVYAIHLSYKRNNGFHTGSMLAAYCYSTMFIIWAFLNPIKEVEPKTA